jgi:hypothetical protein
MPGCHAWQCHPATAVQRSTRSYETEDSKRHGELEVEPDAEQTMLLAGIHNLFSVGSVSIMKLHWVPHLEF